MNENKTLYEKHEDIWGTITIHEASNGLPLDELLDDIEMDLIEQIEEKNNKLNQLQAAIAKLAAGDEVGASEHLEDMWGGDI